MTTDRKAFVAALPRSAQRTLAAIEAARGDRVTVALSYTALADDHRIGRTSLRFALKALEAVGLVSVERTGPHGVSTFALSDRWQPGPCRSLQWSPSSEVAETRRPRNPAAPKRPKRTVEIEQPDEPEIQVQRQVPSFAAFAVHGRDLR